MALIHLLSLAGLTLHDFQCIMRTYHPISKQNSPACWILMEMVRSRSDTIIFISLLGHYGMQEIASITKMLYTRIVSSTLNIYSAIIKNWRVSCSFSYLQDFRWHWWPLVLQAEGQNVVPTLAFLVAKVLLSVAKTRRDAQTDQGNQGSDNSMCDLLSSLSLHWGSLEFCFVIYAHLMRPVSFVSRLIFGLVL